MSDLSDVELLVVTSRHCPHCATLKRKLDKSGISYTELSVDDDEFARRLADALDIMAVPTLVARKGNEYCRIRIDKDKGIVPEKCVKIK